jgi:hypothetical protein
MPLRSATLYKILLVSKNDIFINGPTRTEQDVLIKGLGLLIVSLIILCQFYGSYTRKDKTKPDITPYRQIEPPTVAIEVPTLFARSQPPQSNPVNGAGYSFSSSDGSKTPAAGKSVPSTPYHPTVPPSPFTEASMTPSTQTA